MRLFSTLILILLLSLTLVQSASAAIAYVDHTVDDNEVFGSPDANDFAHIVPAGDDRYLVVAITSWNDDCSAVDYGATGLVKLGWLQPGSGPLTTCHLWGVVLGSSATPDTADIAITSSTGNWYHYVCIAANYTGVHQSSAVGDTVGRTGTSVDSLTASVTSVAANSMLFGFAIGQDNGPMAPLNSQTERWDATTGGANSFSYWGADLTLTSAQAYDFGVDATSAANMTLLAVEVKAAAVGAVLALDPETLNFTYAEPDSHAMKFGISNTGGGILSWETTNICAWLSGSCVDTGTVGAGYDSVTVEVLWDSVDSLASWSDTVAVAGGGDGQVVINVTGKQAQGADYTVEANHPRVFFNENTIAALRAVCNSAESAHYDQHKTEVDNNVVPDSYPLGTIAAMGGNLKYLAFSYAIEQDTTYLHEAVLCAQSMFDDFAGSWRSQKESYPLFYDWCYGGMGATRRELFGDSLAMMCKYHLEGASFMSNAPHTQMETVLTSLVEIGLALDGDGLVAHAGIDGDSLASALLDSIYAHTFGDHHVGACFDSIGRDGGGYEGEYTERVLGREFTEDCWLWEIGTDLSAWTQSSCIQGYGDYMLYDTGPKSTLTGAYAFTEGKQSDSVRHAGSRDVKRINVERLANAYDDSTLTWLADQFVAQGVGAINTVNKMEYLIVVDTLAAAVSPSTAGYLSAKQFDVGTVFMREGWDLALTSTDLWATYRHEQFPYGHSHADAGHFIIGRGNDLLFIASGQYTGTTSAHHVNYFRQTMGHNCITIKKLAETFAGTSENTGGQQYINYSTAGYLPTTLGGYTDSLTTIYGDRGKIATYEHHPDTLTYIKSDLTKAYISSKVDTVRREFVWWEQHDTFLIFDYADVDSASFVQKSIFHTIDAPSVSNDVWTVTNGTSEARITFHGNASADTIGGTGNEFWVNGTNYPPASPNDDSGAWRIEATMPVDSAQRWLLTIIETSALGGADYGSVSVVTSGDYIGAAVNNDTLLFHKYGGAYTRDLTGELAILDLDPTELNFSYADSFARKFGIGNSGEGILSWETTNICDWISAGVADTGTVGAGYDSVTVQLMWAAVDSGAAWSDTVAVSGGGDGQVVISVAGKPADEQEAGRRPIALGFTRRGGRR